MGLRGSSGAPLDGGYILVSIDGQRGVAAQ